MSWFTGLAGRAEAFLDKMDQAAATSLKEAGVGKTSKSDHHVSSQSFSSSSSGGTSSLAYEPTAQPAPRASHSFNGTERTSVTSAPIKGSKFIPKSYLSAPQSTTPEQSVKPPSSPPSSSAGKRQSAASEDSLFDFLNSPSKEQSQDRASVKSRVVKSQLPVKGASYVPPKGGVAVAGGSWSSLGSLESEAKSGRGGAASNDETDAPPQPPLPATDGPQITPPTAQEKHSEHRDDDSHETELEQGGAEREEGKGSHERSPPTTTPAADPQPEPPGAAEVVSLQQRVSNLELENRLLRREVSSLNDEMGAMLERVREAEGGAGRHREELASQREQAARLDHVIQQLRSREEDLQAMLNTRDSQIDILRVQLSKADKNVDELKLRTSSFEKEKERLLQDASLSSSSHNHALESVKAQLAEVQALLQQEREMVAAHRTESAERESRLESERQQLSDALSLQQKQLGLHHAKVTENQAALQSARSQLQLLKREHEEYKQRAAGILQAKEKLIASLQSGGGGGGAAQEAKLEEARLEKEDLLAQLQHAQLQIEHIKADMQEMEDRHASEVEQLLDQVREMEETLEEERKQHTTVQAELTRLSLEVEDSRSDSTRERAVLVAQLKDKESELVSLRVKSSLSPAAAQGRSELESRLRELTESLIEKQTTLEALTSEKSSLRLQLDRVKRQLSEAQKQQSTKTQAVAVNGLDEVGSEDLHVRPMSSVLTSLERAPSSSRLHNVTRAMNMVDRFSIRMGVFLRRYPYARLFAVFYMVLLHIWVMIVLLTYTPEVHDLDNPRAAMM